MYARLTNDNQMQSDTWTLVELLKHNWNLVEHLSKFIEFQQVYSSLPLIFFAQRGPVLSGSLSV